MPFRYDNSTNEVSLLRAEIERLRAALKEIEQWNNRTSLSEPRLIARRALCGLEQKAEDR